MHRVREVTASCHVVVAVDLICPLDRSCSGQFFISLPYGGSMILVCVGVFWIGVLFGTFNDDNGGVLVFPTIITSTILLYYVGKGAGLWE